MAPFVPIQKHGILCFGGNVAWAKLIFSKLNVYGVLWYPDQKVCWVSCSTWSAVSYAMAFLWCQKMKNSGNFISLVTCGTEIFKIMLVLSSVFWLILRKKVSLSNMGKLSNQGVGAYEILSTFSGWMVMKCQKIAIGTVENTIHFKAQ